MNLPGLVARMSLPLAAGISILLARRAPSYRPVSQTLFLGACFDLARGNVTGTIFSPSLLLAFPCLSASLSLKVLGRLPRWPVGIVWGALAALTLIPSSRAFLEPLGRVYGAVHVGGLLVQVFGIWRWARRGSKFNVDRADVNVSREDARQKKMSDRSDTLAPFAVLILFAGDLAALFGPFAAGDPRRDWYVAHAQTVLLFLVFNVWQVCQIRKLGGNRGPRIL